jgi:hypothetical protein
VTVPRPRPGHAPSKNDALIAGLLSAAALLAACGSGFLSLFFAMAGDACVSTAASGCRRGGSDLVMLLAYVITWGGAAGSLRFAFGQSAKASRRGERTWPFPAAAIALIVGTFIAGAMVASLYPKF